MGRAFLPTFTTKVSGCAKAEEDGNGSLGSLVFGSAIGSLGLTGSLLGSLGSESCED